MKTQSKSTRLFSMILALCLLAGALPAALAENSFAAVVTAESMGVYSPQSPYDYLGALPKGTQVTVEAYSGSVALIRYKGNAGLARIGDLQAVTAAPAASEAVESTMSRPVVALRDTRVYSKASTRSRYVTVRAGTAMTLLGVSGSCAKVERDGAVGYAVYSHLGEPGSALQSAEQAAAAQNAPAEPAQAPEVKTGSAAVVTNRSTRIYSKASTRSAYVTVEKGTALTLTAVSGSCARVERGGAVGYTFVDHLTSDTGSSGSAESAGQSPVQTADAKAASSGFSSGSAEYVIYKFLVGEMGFNRAAAMGVLANMYYESNYQPTIPGDSGTSYGLCQWHAGRKTNLINWCNENGFDYTTIEGQLRFLQYELPTRYPSVYSYLKKVENTAEGAYDAAYYFCFNFEAPAARTSQSTARGKYARDKLYRL